MRDTSSNLVDPLMLTDAAKLERWTWSEWHVMGVIMGTATDLHYKLLSKHENGAAWPLWKAIETQHVSQDVSLCHKVWMQLFGICKRPEEAYLNLYHCVNNAHSRIDHVTPVNQSSEDHSNEIALFTLLGMLHADDPLCCQLVSQKGTTLNNAYSAFLHTDRDTMVASKIELASIAFSSCCHKCDQPSHYGRDCPHFNAIAQLIS